MSEAATTSRAIFRSDPREWPWDARPPLPPTRRAGGAPVQIRGTLTIRGLTRPPTGEGTVEFSGSTVRLQARTVFTFADFALPQPRVMRVLSIDDHIRLEVDLTLRQAS